MEQHEDIGTQKDLVLYRIESAKEDLKAAKLLLNAEAYKAAISSTKHKIKIYKEET